MASSQHSGIFLSLPIPFSLVSFLLITIVCFGASTGYSQETTGTLEGRAVDSLGAPVAGVIVAVASPNLQGERGTTTNEEGFFRLPALPIGEYAVRMSHVAHKEATFRDVRVRLGARTSLGTVRLQAEAVQMPEVMAVSSAPLIDPVSTTAGGSLLPEEFESLPVQRTYDKIIALLPQANESYLGDGVNVAGATGMENKYFVDGVDVSDPYRGLTGGSLPYNIIREIEVRTGAYEAEYRSTLGGIVNVVTYSGGNDFSGRAYSYFTNNDLSGTPRGGTLRPSSGKFAQYDFGVALGGPILRDRLWFYLAYSPVFTSEDVDVPGLGYYPDRTTSHVVAGKLTWRASENHSLMLSLSGDPTVRNAVGQAFGEFGTPAAFLNADPYLGRATLGGLGVRLKGTHIMSDVTLLEFTLSYMNRNDRFMPQTAAGKTQPFFINMATGTWSGGYPMRVDDQSSVAEGSVRGTVQMGNHMLKGGAGYSDTKLDAQFSVEMIQRFSPFAYTMIKYGSNGVLHNRAPSAFLQDSWEAASWLTLNAGVRWDGQFIIGSDGRVAQRILGQWQPRLGVVIRPESDVAGKITASYGRFYQDLLMYASTLYHIAGATQQVTGYGQDPRTNPAGGRPIVNVVSAIQPEIKGLRGQAYEEFTLGYEREVSGGFVGGVRGVYRMLLDAIEDAEAPTGSKELVLGNPGRSLLSSYPGPERTYAGLEFTLRRTPEANPWFLVSYVLSRTAGNYPGLFNSDFDVRLPNANKSFDYVENLVNASGRLPNDRTHVVKLSASYRFDFNVTAGVFAVWQSGTPLSEFGGSRAGGFNYNFLGKRGTNGQTPSLWDLNIRLTYDIPSILVSDLRVRLIADAVHVGSSRTAVDYDQIRYFNVDAAGNQINPNPLYMQPVKFQPPMSFRLGLEVMF